LNGVVGAGVIVSKAGAGAVECLAMTTRKRVFGVETPTAGTVTLPIVAHRGAATLGEHALHFGAMECITFSRIV
jgi:hypothetical protein